MIGTLLSLCQGLGGKHGVWASATCVS